VSLAQEENSTTGIETQGKAENKDSENIIINPQETPITKIQEIIDIGPIEIITNTP
jgi:hypothetical protein